MAKDDLDDVFGVAGGDNKEGAEDADAPKEEEEEAVEEVEDDALSRWQRFRQKRRRRRESRAYEQEEINEYWYKDANINVNVPKADAPYEILEQSLWDNRLALENLKHAYCRSYSRRNKEVRDSYMHEIKRLVSAIESTKDVLAGRGEYYPVSYRDREHPEQACRRHRLCMVATAMYGEQAPETRQLRHFRDHVLEPRWWGRALTNTYYHVVGPITVTVLKHFPSLRPTARKLVGAVARLTKQAVKR